MSALNEWKKMQGGFLATPGLRGQGIHVGIRKNVDKQDLCLMTWPAPTPVAGVFTTNDLKSICVLENRRKIKKGFVRALVVNSGVANTCTGDEGERNYHAVCRQAAESLGCHSDQILFASTGVIGNQLPMARIQKGLRTLLQGTGRDALSLARAIMTTDTVPKYSAYRHGKHTDLVLGGMTKGAGMICPNMATTLTFVSTSAALAQADMQAVLSQAVQETYNMMCIDNDQSPNDMLLWFGLPPGAGVNAPLKTTTQGLKMLLSELAKKLVLDGEGVTKLVCINLSGCRDLPQARQVGRAIAGSMLVKTAIFGEDPNWGRVVNAMGYAGAGLNMDKVSLTINGHRLFENGQPTGRLKRLSGKEIHLDVNLASGKKSYQFLTGDLSYEYVKINAEYTT